MSNLTREYSQRLGVLTAEQLQAALDRFDLGGLIDARPAPGGLFGQNVLLTSTKGAHANPRHHYLTARLNRMSSARYAAALTVG